MTKKFFFASAVAASVMTLASCSSEEVLLTGNDNSVTFTAQLPESVNSRAYSDGTLATVLKYAVYDGDKLVMTDDNGPAATYNPADMTFSLTFNLAKGKTYDFAFWAQADNAPYEFTAADNHAVTVDMNYDTDATANNEKRDAFFNVENGVTVNGAISKTIELRRPFARLNVGTSDYDEWQKSVAEGTDLGNVSVTVSDVYNTLDLFSGIASDAAEVTFTDVRPETAEAFPSVGDDKTYTYLAMDYILTGTEIIADVNHAQQETKDVTIAIADNAGSELCSIPVSAVPFQRNYITNIYGALLTSPLEYVIKVVPDFYKEDYNREVVKVSDFASLKKAVAEGGTVVLTQAMNIGKLELPADKPVTIDLNGNNANLTSSVTVGPENDLTIIGNGNETLGVASTSGVRVEGGKANIENVTIVDNFNYQKYPDYVVPLIIVYENDSELNLKDVTLIPNNGRTYAITTNASVANTGIKVTMENVKVLPSVTMACPTLLNLPMTLTAKNCVFEGCNQAIILRGGTYTFENCTFTQTLAIDENHNTVTTKESIESTYRNLYRAQWGTGSNVPLAAVTMGNKGNAYQYPTNVTLKGCTVNIPEVAKNTTDNVNASLPAIYISANADAAMGVTLLYDAATTINGALEHDAANAANITVNGAPIQ